LKVRDRKIIAWTKVLLGNDAFPRVILKHVLEYTTGQFLNDQIYPRLAPELRGGVVLRLPTTLVKDEIAKLIDLKHLDSDSALVEYLEQELIRAKQSSKSRIEAAIG
jgi:hypothetical protein